MGILFWPSSLKTRRRVDVDNVVNASNLWRLGYSGLLKLRSRYGFDASERETGLYGALFGRDSLWMLLFLLEVIRLRPVPSLVAWVEEAGSDILLSLCRFQGTTVDDTIEEQPGKIIHEYRESMDARLIGMEMPFVGGRSYIGFDQTFLFVIAARQFIERFPAHPLSHNLWPHVKRALDWIRDYADADGDGLFEYQRRDLRSPVNQVWKDSFDSVVHTGFDVPPAPLAWIEVQAYAYRALLDAAVLCSIHEEPEQAERCREQALLLRRQVDEQFWMEREGCYAIVCDGTKKRVPMVSSNAAQALWGTIVEPHRRQPLVQRFMQPDMITAYGLRTLSSASPFYAPFTYHRGSVWPFDNAIFVIGLREHGYQVEARRVIEGVGHAITRIGFPIESYIVLDTATFIYPRLAEAEALSFRRMPPENQNQGWTAAGLMYFAATLASMNGEELPDA